MQIRTLDPVCDLAAVLALYDRAAAFWILTDRKTPDAAKAHAFFTDCPPGCAPSQSHRLGLLDQGALVGVAELSFGFPEACDAYLGLLLLDPAVRGRGVGPVFLAHVETLARARACPRLLLAVLEENPRARVFWQAHGFGPTGLTGFDAETGHTLHRLEKVL